ncbi:MAG: glycoside hydrolase family 13 protein [Promicromonosporaceae bacterium]|nr:glycoside hydrolase family 13 protein [Promicromonosporaceae bacterium]
MTIPDPTMTNLDPNWWRQAVVYQIYPRSFADSNGDGIGDIPGITSRVDYLKNLGINAVWLSPFYPSALADGGYDVDDYRDVDPKLGTLEDFDEMVSALHAVGIKVVVDIVPNHTSNRHVWFQAALKAAPGSPERARYVFRDGLGPNGDLPPADWESFFGGPAWRRVPDTAPGGHPKGGQWYLHMFAPEQPDLNWDNPEVREDFLKTLRFWSDRGVDGFRVDVASMLTKDLSANPLPSWAEIQDGTLWAPGRHPLWDRDEVFDVYHGWRQVFNEYDPPRTAVAEAFVPPDRTHKYATQEGLGQIFNFDLLQANYNAAAFRKIITSHLKFAAQTKSSNTWVLSNHDQVRHVSRYGLPNNPPGAREGHMGRQWDLHGGKNMSINAEQGLRRGRAAIMLLLALPGSTYLYQGEELGLPQVTGIPDHARQDPTFFTNPGVDVGRDGCRVPLPWQADAPAFGFGTSRGPRGVAKASSGGETTSHLPQPEYWGDFAVDVELADPDSTLRFYQKAIKLRQQLEAPEETLTWLDPDVELPGISAAAANDVLLFSRPPVADGSTWVCVSNFGTDPVPMPKGEVLLASGPLPNPGELPGETTAWLRR